MTKSEKNALFKFAHALSDEDLEREYYDSVYRCLGSEADMMCELGFDERDIKERRKYEKYLSQRSDILGMLCEQRGIRLWVRKEVALLDNGNTLASNV